MTPQELKAIQDLVAAAKPFTNGNVVDETTGTIPLMERLQQAIEQVAEFITSRPPEESADVNTKPITGPADWWIH